MGTFIGHSVVPIRGAVSEGTYVIPNVSVIALAKPFCKEALVAGLLGLPSRTDHYIAALPTCEANQEIDVSVPDLRNNW